MSQVVPAQNPSIVTPQPRAGVWTLALGSIGVVYGDIGTSPLYALKESLTAATAGGQLRGRLDAAFMRPEERADELVYRRVITEPFVVILPSDHRLAVRDSVELREIVGETFIIPSKTAPTSRVVIEDYLKRSGLDIVPDHEV